MFSRFVKDYKSKLNWTLDANRVPLFWNSYILSDNILRKIKIPELQLHLHDSQNKHKEVLLSKLLWYKSELNCDDITRDNKAFEMDDKMNTLLFRIKFIVWRKEQFNINISCITKCNLTSIIFSLTSYKIMFALPEFIIINTNLSWQKYVSFCTAMCYILSLTKLDIYIRHILLFTNYWAKFRDPTASVCNWVETVPSMFSN